MRDPVVLVLDIRDAIADVLDFAEGGRDEFLSSKKTQYSVIRALEIMGEAAKSVPPEARQRWPAVPWKQLAGFRDVLIHRYQRVDLELVWRIVKEELPKLQVVVAEILRAEMPAETPPVPPPPPRAPGP